MKARIKNPRFLAFYSWSTRWSTLNTKYAARTWGNYLWREAFASQNRGIDSKLPANTETLYAKVTCDNWQTSIELILEPIGPRTIAGRRAPCKHRVFVMCDRCDKKVPAGRIHQHTC